MKEEKKASPISVLLDGANRITKIHRQCRPCVLGVACQMMPYFCVAHIVTMMLDGEQDFSRYVTACMVALCGYLGKVLFSSLSTTVSHTAAYYTLRISGEADRETGPRSDGDDPGYSVRSV